jgi:hypothetical protein
MDSQITAQPTMMEQQGDYRMGTRIKQCCHTAPFRQERYPAVGIPSAIITWVISDTVAAKRGCNTQLDSIE